MEWGDVRCEIETFVRDFLLDFLIMLSGGFLSRRVHGFGKISSFENPFL